MTLHCSKKIHSNHHERYLRVRLCIEVFILHTWKQNNKLKNICDAVAGIGEHANVTRLLGLHEIAYERIMCSSCDYWKMIQKINTVSKYTYSFLSCHMLFFLSFSLVEN
jgi:hypothetical protein